MPFRPSPRVQFWLGFIVPWTFSAGITLWDMSGHHGGGFFPNFDPRLLGGGLLFTGLVPAVALRKRAPDLTRGIWLGLLFCPFVLWGVAAAFFFVTTNVFHV